jgi:hypothetical protein
MSRVNSAVKIKSAIHPIIFFTSQQAPELNENIFDLISAVFSILSKFLVLTNCSVMSVDIKAIVDNIKIKWLECLEKSPEVFRYRLNIEHEKILDGKFNFFVQVKVQ